MARQALEDFQHLGTRREQAQALSALALMMHMDQEHEGALDLYNEGLALSQVDATSWGHQRDVLKSNSGVLHLQLGDIDQAQALIEDTAYLAQGRSDHQAQHLQVLLGVLMHRQERFGAAVHCFQTLKQTLHAAHASADLHTLLDGFIALSAQAQHPDPSHAETIGRALGIDLPPIAPLWQALLHRLFRAESELLHAHEDVILLTIHEEERWLELDQRVDMKRRGPMWRLLLCLARAHEQQPAQPVHAIDLFLQGWPQAQGSIPETGMHRLYSTMNRLRRLGFEALIMTLDEGYLLQLNTRITWSTTPTP